jgi:hypothetical protein
VRVRQQHRPDAGQAGQRDVLAQEVLVKALPAGEVLERRGGRRQQSSSMRRTLPARGDGGLNGCSSRRPAGRGTPVLVAAG